jgi:GAF domain-containing protein
MINYKMPIDIIPDDEIIRIDTLNRLEILNTLPEADFDAIVLLASEIFETERAHICFVDKDHVFIKAIRPCREVMEVSREQSLCALSILKEGVTVYDDIQKFYELQDTTFISKIDDLRFYAAAPIRTSDGFALGTVCVTDDKPHFETTNKQTKLLQILADIVMEKLEARIAVIKTIKAQEENLRRLSHDLKNPVTSISLYAQLLGTREMSAEKVFSMAAKIESASKKIEKLISKNLTDN